MNNIVEISKYILISLLANAAVISLIIWIAKKYFSYKFDFVSKTANLKLERLNVVFNNAISQAQSIHVISASLRKKVAFLSAFPGDQPEKYSTVTDMENDLTNDFNNLEIIFQESRISLIFLDEELFKSMHTLKRSFGFIIKRTQDIIKLHGNKLGFVELHDLITREKACLSNLSDIETNFQTAEAALVKIIKRYGIPI